MVSLHSTLVRAIVGLVACGFAVPLLRAQEPVAVPGPAVTYDTVAHELRGLRPRSDRTAVVRDLVIEREAARFTFEQGTLSLLSPVGGRTIGAVFVGQGTFAFAAPTAVEADQLQRFLQQRQLAEPFTAVVLLFADSTLEELGARVYFGEHAAGAGAASAVKDALMYLREPETEAYDPDLLRPLLNGAPGDWFYAHVVRRGDPVMFVINPYETEAVQLHRKAKIRRRRVSEVVAQFPVARQGPVDPSASSDRVGDATVRHYELEVWLSRNTMGNLSFSARARLAIQRDDAEGPWVPLVLYPELRVDSARWVDGAPAMVTKLERAATMWIRMPDDGAPARGDTLELFYGGDLIDRFASFFFIKESGVWYPRSLDGRSPATFDLTYHSPASYRLASVGRRVDERTEGNVVTTRWVADRPMRNASFNIGQFEVLDVPGDSGPAVTLLYSDEGHRAIARLLDYPGTGKVNQQGVAQDLSQSLKFFTRLYGALPAAGLYATEIPYFHGEAFPGLLHLSVGTFEPARDTRGYEDVFRAHEVAHQWWGIGVDFATYHDQWLSEGIAEFSGLWYMQTARRKNDLYFGMLRRWRDQLLERRGGASGEEAEVGPIALGYRTASSTSPDAYGLMVYRKGAWVLHMLRVLMLDLRTVNEDAFTATLRDFYASYAGQRASTADFQAVAERHAGVPLDWFFDQWVHGSAVPTYVVAHRWEPAGDGKWRVRIRVRQTGVPDTFRMLVPISVDLGNNRFARMRINVQGPLTELELPLLLPSEPVGLRFNELDGVLCEMKLEKW